MPGLNKSIETTNKPLPSLPSLDEKDIFENFTPALVTETSDKTPYLFMFRESEKHCSFGEKKEKYHISLLNIGEDRREEYILIYGTRRDRKGLYIGSRDKAYEIYHKLGFKFLKNYLKGNNIPLSRIQNEKLVLDERLKNITIHSHDGSYAVLARYADLNHEEGDHTLIITPHKRLEVIGKTNEYLTINDLLNMKLKEPKNIPPDVSIRPDGYLLH